MSAPYGQTFDAFGTAVSIKGVFAVVGSPSGVDAPKASGSAHVFRLDDGETPADSEDDAWVHQQVLTASDAAMGDGFGFSVSLGCNHLVVGAPNDDDGGTDSGSAYVYRRQSNGTPLIAADDTWTQQAKLRASDSTEGDQFGISVCLYGDHLVVGASGNEERFSPGFAYVFRRDDNDTPSESADDLWVEEEKLIAPDAFAFDLFGISVSMHGDRLIVGSSRDDDAGTNSGSAHVYRHDDGSTPGDPTDDTWSYEMKLTARDADRFDQFGTSVAIHGDRAIVGEFGDDNIGLSSGSAYVFRLDDRRTPLNPNDDRWVQEVKLTASDEAALDQFGLSVAINNTHALVGARRNDEAGTDSGAAYLFHLDRNRSPEDPTDDFWVEQTKFTASDAGPGDQFGHSISLGERNILIGARLDDDSGADSGSAYVYGLDLPGVTLADYARFANCFGRSACLECADLDFAPDGRIDLVDAALVATALKGP